MDSRLRNLLAAAAVGALSAFPTAASASWTFERAHAALTLTPERAMREWPERSRRLALKVIAAYGRPQTITLRRVSWTDVGPWRRITVHEKGRGILEQTISLSAANIMPRELTARSDSEEENRRALEAAKAALATASQSEGSLAGRP